MGTKKAEGGHPDLVLHQGGELAVQVGGEPEAWPEQLEQLLGGAAAQAVGLHLGPEELLAPQQGLLVPVVVDPPGPVVGYHHVQGLAQLDPGEKKLDAARSPECFPQRNINGSNPHKKEGLRLSPNCRLRTHLLLCTQRGSTQGGIR